MLIAKWLNNCGAELGCVTGEDREDLKRVIISCLCRGEEWEGFGDDGDSIVVTGVEEC